MNRNLSTLVVKLRQEQEFVSFYKQQIRQSVQELNSSCDQVFQSLWLSHTLSYGLHRVLTHNSHPYEWSRALGYLDSVKFVNASKVVKSQLFVDRYSRFLMGLLNNPELLSGILNHVELEGLDCSWVVNDLMSVVYGHCMFKKDHILFLKLLRELLKQHIEHCDSPKDLFGGVESVFNHVLTEYCSQLVELRTYLTSVLHDPLMQVLACEEHLEYDVNKAGSRFQKNSEQNGLVSSSTFLFNEDLEVSCEKLAKLSSQFLENLSSLTSQLPISLQWLLGNLKNMVKQKWPNVSTMDLRRPVSDAIFSSILSSAVVNPDHYGVVDPSIIINEVGRYNLTQIMSVLQGCVWIMDKPTSVKYPIHKVVRRMDVGLFFSLVDSIDGGMSSSSIPDLPSFLPGVNRSAFLASQEQLDNLVGLVAILVSNREGKGKFHSGLSNLLGCLLQSMIEQASHNPYPITSKAPHIHSPPPTGTADQEKVKSLSRKKAKKGFGGSAERLDAMPGGSLGHLYQQQRGKSLLSPQTTPDGKSKSAGSEKHLKQSVSSDGGFSPLPAGFHLPEQVLVLPVLEKLDEGMSQWDFYLLAEEEFMGQKSPSPGPKSEDQSYFTSFLRSQPVPRTLDLTTPPVMAAGLRDSWEAEEQVTNMVRSSLASRGRVKSMIDALEREERTRSNTLPCVLSTNSHVGNGETPNDHAHSVGTTPTKSSMLLNGKAGHGSDNPSDQLDSLIGVRSNERGNKSPHSPASRRPFTEKQEPRKLSTTFEVSLEESISYVKMHPPCFENDNSVLSQRLEEEEEVEEEGEKGGAGEEHSKSKGSRTEEVVITQVRDESREESVNSEHLSGQELEHSGEKVGNNLSGVSSSDELVGMVLHGGQNDSLVNLYQMEEGGSPQMGKGKQKKKKKWRLFKKRKSTEAQSSPKPVRSQTDSGAHLNTTQEVVRRDKKRSVSDNTVLDVGKRARGGGSRKVDRYTIYMQDYTAKWKESKKREEEGEGLSTMQEGEGHGSLEDLDRDSTDDGLDNLVESLPPAEMTPMTFKQSLFCKQLQYKLRSALQNIHTPLILSHTFQQLQLDNGLTVDARFQLILMIQHALRRTQWKQDDLETALLTEILRMVEPLPTYLIQVAIDGVLEDYHRRSSYIAYLVHSQQKFQDARTQVKAVQESIKRIMYINTELFVNFAVRMFLEAPGQPRLLQLQSFSQQMETLFLADEKCSLMNRQLETFRAALQEDKLTWEQWQDKEKVLACLGDFLFTYIHQHIFHPNGHTDVEVDKIFCDHLAALSKTISMTHRSLQIPFVYHSGCPWVASQKQLKAMAAYKSPQGKLHCIVQSLRILISLLQYARCGDPPGADDLFPVLVYVLIKANPPGVLSTCQYIRNFAENSLQGEDAYWWAQFSTAIEFTKTLS